MKRMYTWIFSYILIVGMSGILVAGDETAFKRDKRTSSNRQRTICIDKANSSIKVADISGEPFSFSCQLVPRYGEKNHITD
ncbi:MAG TPA: hypothetical protein ENI08_03700, partial [Candidatus Dependentiae bacterium]|nr:hypothetical protein [Candidatus Dependentiae bacterium]